MQNDEEYWVYTAHAEHFINMEVFFPLKMEGHNLCVSLVRQHKMSRKPGSKNSSSAMEF